jgi:hypothetical protein
VIVSKDVQIGDIGIFFPIESKLSENYLKFNNLYRDKTLNNDSEKAGFFEKNGRVRAVKLRGHKSEGLYMPFDSLWMLEGVILDKNIQDYIGESFDHINDIKICEKYVIPRRQQGQGNKKGKKPKISRIVDGQFRFHVDTEQLYKNLGKIDLDDEYQISAKWHGTSAISSYILCNKKLNIFQKLLLKSGLKLQTKYYDYIWSSRKVIKNDDINKTQHFYTEDIWKKGHNILQEYLQKGMTIYYEICGYLSDGKQIQKGYDYGCKSGEFKLYIYRITITNEDGKIFEFSYDQVQQWCNLYGLNSVIELYKGTIRNLYKTIFKKRITKNWKDNFLELLREHFKIEEDCPYNITKVPTEGIVLRKNSLDINVMKLKGFRFYEYETKQLDSEEENIEDNQDDISN